MESIQKILNGEIRTSGTIVPEALRQSYVSHGFEEGQNNKKVLLVAGEPRKYSLTYD